MIELLNICAIDNTDLVLWLTYCMKKSRVQTCPKSGWGGGGQLPPGPPSPTPVPPDPSGSNHPHSSVFLRIFLPEYGLRIFTYLHGFAD